MSQVIPKMFLKNTSELQFKAVWSRGNNAKENYCGIQKYCWFLLLQHR